MKALLFGLSALGMLYGSLRWEWVANLMIGLFIGGSFFAIAYPLYRHFSANRLL